MAFLSDTAHGGAAPTPPSAGAWVSAIASSPWRSDEQARADEPVRVAGDEEGRELQLHDVGRCAEDATTSLWSDHPDCHFGSPC